MEIISIHKRFNKTETKRGAKAKARTRSKTESKRGANTASKAPRTGYHLFLREQFEKMTGEDRKNYRSIVLRMWKKIKGDPARLFTYNITARKMRDEAEKPAKVGSMEQQAVTERSVVKMIQRQPRKTPKSPEFVETESDDSDNNNEEEEPVVKRIHKLTKKAPKSPGFVETESDNSGNNGEEEEPVIKRIYGLTEKAPKPPGLTDTYPRDFISYFCFVFSIPALVGGSYI